LCFSVGAPGSEDLKWAKDVSYALNLPLYVKEFSIDDFSEALSDVVKILKTDDAVKASIGAVTYSALKLAKEHGVNMVFSGLGSEEIFAGYERHLKSLKWGDVNAECRAGLHSMYKRDIMRDFPLAESLGMRIMTPFLDEEIIRFGMGLSPVLKINDSEKKIIVRKSALLMGIPEKIAGRKKRAAQYGSGFDKILKKLAKRKGFSFRKDYLADILKKP
ncbi:MAG: asparagine synthase-related protein, partial [Candidatus Woesearchaeota archaeon]|nr:asparagine synthase-related protein [Candidatus Woesearchaeota archaeon]